MRCEKSVRMKVIMRFYSYVFAPCWCLCHSETLSRLRFNIQEGEVFKRPFKDFWEDIVKEYFLAKSGSTRRLFRACADRFRNTVVDCGRNGLGQNDDFFPLRKKMQASTIYGILDFESNGRFSTHSFLLVCPALFSYLFFFRQALLHM